MGQCVWAAFGVAVLVKLPPKCKHCGAREPLDKDGFCIDYEACIFRRPLAGTRKEDNGKTS